MGKRSLVMILKTNLYSLTLCKAVDQLLKLKSVDLQRVIGRMKGNLFDPL